MWRSADSVINQLQLQFNAYCLKFESQLPTVEAKFSLGPDMLLYNLEIEINDLTKLLHYNHSFHSSIIAVDTIPLGDLGERIR